MKLLGDKKKSPHGAVVAKAPSLVLQIANQYIRWIVLLAIGIVLLLGYVFLLDTAITNLQSVARDSLPAKEKVLSDLQSIKEELDQIVIDFDAIMATKQEFVERLDTLLPRTSDYGDLYTIIDEVTRQAG